MRMTLRKIGRCLALTTAVVGLSAQSLQAQHHGDGTMPCTEPEFHLDEHTLEKAQVLQLNLLQPGIAHVIEEFLKKKAPGQPVSHRFVHAAADWAVMLSAIRTAEAWAAGDEHARNHAAVEALSEAGVALAGYATGMPLSVFYAAVHLVKAAYHAAECPRVAAEFGRLYLKDTNLHRQGTYTKEQIDYFINNYAIGVHSGTTFTLMGCLTEEATTIDQSKLQTSNPASSFFGLDRIANVGVYQMNVGAVRTMSLVTLNTYADLLKAKQSAEFQALRKDLSEFAPKVCASYRSMRQGGQAPKTFTGLLTFKFNFGGGEASTFGLADANGTIAGRKLKDRGNPYRVDCAVPGGLPAAPGQQGGISCFATAAAGPDFAGWQFQGTVRSLGQDRWEADGTAQHPRSGGPVKMTLERSGRSLAEVE